MKVPYNGLLEHVPDFLRLELVVSDEILKCHNSFGEGFCCLLVLAAEEVLSTTFRLEFWDFLLVHLNRMGQYASVDFAVVRFLFLIVERLGFFLSCHLNI